jgi:hypothetical protein
VSKGKTRSRKGVRHQQGILGARASPEPQKWPTTRELAFLKRKEEELHHNMPLEIFWISLGISWNTSLASILFIAHISTSFLEI